MAYAHITQNTNPKAFAGGYKGVFRFAKVTDFDTIAAPVGPFAAVGDSLKITDDHEFTAPKGFTEYACKKHGITLKGATVGDPGAREMEWTAEFTILGDSASTSEQISNLLNDDVICLMKEADCLNADEYVQLGDECVQPEFDVTFDGKTTADGKKEYTVSVKCKAKYFYTGTVVKAA